METPLVHYQDLAKNGGLTLKTPHFQKGGSMDVLFDNGLKAHITTADTSLEEARKGTLLLAADVDFPHSDISEAVNKHTIAGMDTVLADYARLELPSPKVNGAGVSSNQSRRQV